MLQGNEIIIITIDEAEKLLQLAHNKTMAELRKLQKVGVLDVVGSLRSIVQKLQDE